MDEIVRVPTFGILETMQVDDAWVEQREREEAEEKRKENLEAKEKWYREKSGAPERYWGESFDTYKASEQNARASEWLRGFCKAVRERRNTKNIVYLEGQRGTGKTHLGCAFVRELSGLIMTSYRMCLTYDSCRDFSSRETRVEFFDRLCGSPVLVIDEVGKGIKGIEEQLLPQLVDAFYNSGRVLLMLGNLERSRFEKLITEDGRDRMNEVGVYFSLVGESHRGKS